MMGEGGPPRYMRGMLSFLIISLLRDREMYGCEIMRRIEKLSGKAPNPGTLYPALKRLENMRTIKSCRRGKEIFYTLTAKGERELELATEFFVNTFSFVFKRHRKREKKVVTRQVTLDALSYLETL
jgi:DNA-binding PadR family transcriptional regulator